MRNTGKRGDKKKLSWIYRKKIRFQKSKRGTEITNNNGEEDKIPRIIVRNVPFKATIEDVQKLYEPFGQISDINFPKRADGIPVGCCFIQFKQLEQASKAIFNTNKKEFLGRIISSSWAIPKSKYSEKLKNESIVNLDNGKVDDNNITKDNALNNDNENQDFDKSDDFDKKEKLTQIRKERRKLLKEKNRKKRARIIVRNLSFQVTEENLKDHFSQYGTIEEVQILKKEDGKHVGCAFLQFNHVQSAAKAIHYANLQPLLDRPIVVDWAVPKNKFCKNSENETNGAVEVKIEKDSDAEDTDLAVTTGDGLCSEDEITDAHDSDSDDLVEAEVKSECENEALDQELSEVDEKDKVNEKEEIKRPRYESHDVSEGKTVFLKNVPFSIKNEELKKYMEQFGPIYYALVCIDPLTEYSKGTAFVKFKNVEDAEKCLSAGTELQMEDQIIEAQRALDKNEIENKANSKHQRQKDSRNLYLVKEGVVLAGSPSSVGVSAADMAKRLQIEQWKSQILRNLNMFVSRVRLVIHNLPATLNDDKLRKIVEQHSPPNATIKEVRIMRDLKNVDMKGVGKSKEYGFVAFTRHEDALETLRNINNNPNIFTPKRRPIVSFSIENRVLVNAKQKRLQKSRENNPLCSENNNNKRKGEKADAEVTIKKLKVGNVDKSDKKSYVGMIGKPGENKLRSKFNIKNQAILHNQTLKKEKKMKKSSKKLDIKRRANIANRNEIKPKQGTKVHADDVNLDKLVHKYKNTLKSIELRKSKWYES
ncbi:RNA-binding protein 28 [Osmia lignaria lignaria]|uniref:RNA-binding protein 28 n=1 Tax=Osmia lignaria lignaria TaxID=1437193 RepID=UPI00402B41AE